MTTEEAQIRGAFEGETVTRRRFMTGTANAAGGIAVAAFTLPAVGFAVAPVFESHEREWEAVGALDDEPRDEYNEYIAISTRCMHLGCPVRFVAASERFICPCHGGVYDFQGKVDGGPPVRPLDRFYTRVRNGNVEVGPRFSVNSELRRFSPRDPGMPLDGVGQYVYPARPSVRKLPGT